MDIQDLRIMVAKHATSTNALVALGLAIDARVRGTTLDGDTARRTEAVLSELGISDVVANTSARELAPVLAGIRADLLSGGKLLSEPSESSRHLEDGMRQAFGDVSAGFPLLLKRLIAPLLADLPERLESPGATFLDIGVGVGALSIAMLRQWPGLKVVGVDPMPEAIAQARSNVMAAGLDDRIELRTGLGQDITEENAFDLVFVPSAFIPEPQVRAIVARGHAALRPGGWLLLAMVKPGPDALGEALARFRTGIFGGTVFEKDAARDCVEQCGYVETRMLPGPAGAPVAFVVGRKPG